MNQLTARRRLNLAINCKAGRCRRAINCTDSSLIAPRTFGVVPTHPETRADFATLFRSEDDLIRAALRVLDLRLHEREITLTSPESVRDYLRLLLTGLEHEVFVTLFLDAQHRLIVAEEMFRGTLTQTSVHPREVVKAALRHNAAAVILAHNHPSGVAEPSRADELLTETLRQTLGLVDGEGHQGQAEAAHRYRRREHGA